MLVQTESDRWVIPPQRALWLPPLHIHSYHLLSQTDLRAIYFSSSLIAECTSFTKSQQVHVITATPLVKELIAGLFSEGGLRQTESTEDSVVASGNSQRGSTFNDGASHAE